MPRPPTWSLFALAGCSPGERPAPIDPAVRELRLVVPGSGLPAEVTPQDANNNLDVAWHEGRLYLAFRTAPTHFASPLATLYVVSSADGFSSTPPEPGASWRHEGTFALGTDVREPQLVSWDGTLHLYFAVLGDDPLAFEPQGTMVTRYRGAGAWDEPEWTDDTTFGCAEPGCAADLVPWRIKDLDGTLYLVGYTGGAGIYDVDADPIRVSWLRSDDAVTWEPVVPGQPVVLEGGGSETDLAFLDGGGIVAVVRNEAGDEDGFGSKVCRAEPGALGDWRCRADPRKYDSPLVFRRGDRFWLVARRNVTDDGRYDLGLDDLDPADQYLRYQVEYWNAPKRCSLWEIDPEALRVDFVLDLPSRGDTCFPEMVEEGGHQVVFNYSSDPEGPDWSWIEGQTRPTGIHRMILDLPE